MGFKTKSKQRCTRTIPVTLLAAALLTMAPLLPAVAADGNDGKPLTTQIVEGSVDTSALPAPPGLSTVAGPLGLAADARNAACNTFGIKNPIGGWYGKGEAGQFSASEHNGDSVTPSEILAFLEEHKEQGSDWAEVIMKLLDICGNGFAFCVVVVPGTFGIGTKVVFCAVCCGGGTGKAPYALCDADHLTAKCGCE